MVISMIRRVAGLTWLTQADGTWTSNRRGRKRKNPSPEKWALMTKRPKWDSHTPDEELTEEDEYAELDSDEEVDPADPSSQAMYREISGHARNSTGRAEGSWTAVNGDQASRPSPLMRSATEPVPRPARTKMVTSPNHPSPQSAEAVPNGVNTINSIIPSEHAAEAADLVPPMYSQKRRRLSPPDPGQDPDSGTSLGTGIATSPPAFTPAGVMFDRDEVIDFLNRGVARAEQSTKEYDADQIARRRTFEMSTMRANRRLHDAQERIRWLSYENGENKKDRERELGELLKKHQKEQQRLRQDVEREHRAREEAQIKNIEALARQNDALRRQIEELRGGAPYRSPPAEARDAKMQQLPVSPASPDDESARDLAMKEELLPPPPPIELAARAPTRSPPPAAIAVSAEGPHGVWAHAQSASEKAVADVGTDSDALARALSKLCADFDDMAPKAALRTLTALREQSEVATVTVGGAAQRLSELRRAVEDVLAKTAPPTSPRAMDNGPTEKPKVNGIVADVPPVPATLPELSEDFDMAESSPAAVADVTVAGPAAGAPKAAVEPADEPVAPKAAETEEAAKATEAASLRDQIV